MRTFNCNRKKQNIEFTIINKTEGIVTKRFTYGFHWAKHNIGDDLSASRGNEETDCLILGGLLTESTSVDILEDFIETELSESLHRISSKSWEPSLNKLGVSELFD